MYDAIVFDWETLNNLPNAVVLDLAAVVFNLEELDTFEDLVNDKERTFRVKFEVEHQVKEFKRSIGKGTMAFWNRQDPEARKVLMPSVEDKTLLQGMNLFEAFLIKHGVLNQKRFFGYVRGQSFDFPIMDSVQHQVWGEDKYPENSFPVKFWNQRDIRTAIEHDLSTIGNTKCPFPVGHFKGFIPHNSIHDCVRDVISLQTARRYKEGLLEIPDELEMY